MNENKVLFIEKMQESVNEFLGEGVTDKKLKEINTVIRSTIEEFVKDEVLDADKWKEDNMTFVRETPNRSGEVDIVLPAWIYDWLDEED